MQVRDRINIYKYFSEDPPTFCVIFLHCLISFASDNIAILSCNGSLGGLTSDYKNNERNFIIKIRMLPMEFRYYRSNYYFNILSAVSFILTAYFLPAFRRFNLKNKNAPNGHVPKPRSAHASTVIGHKIYIFGGLAEPIEQLSCFGDLHVLNAGKIKIIPTRM